MERFIKARVFLLFLIPLVMLGCYPGSDASSVADFDLQATIYDPNVDFSTYRTYAMPDTVILIADEDADPDEIVIDPELQATILNEIEMQMSARGYIRIADEDVADLGADLVLLVSVTTTEWTGYVSYPWWGYWGWYPGWGYPGYPGFGPGWGWGYPCCAGGVVYRYSTGSILIDMADPTGDAIDREDMQGLWGAVLNGLLEDSSSSTRNRVVSGIQQIFEQSPYLGAGAT